MVFTKGSRSSSCLKKNMCVNLASKRSGFLLARRTKSKRSCRLSRPRQNATSDLFSQWGPVLPCTESKSNVTLEQWHKEDGGNSYYFQYEGPMLLVQRRWGKFVLLSIWWLSTDGPKKMEKVCTIISMVVKCWWSKEYRENSYYQYKSPILINDSPKNMGGNSYYYQYSG